MRSMQVRATQLQDAPAAQLEVLAARSRELRLRISDLQAREQQVREQRYVPQAGGPDRAALDRQWLEVRHSLTATTLELEAVNDRISEARVRRDQALRDQERPVVFGSTPPAGPEPSAVDVPGVANAGTVMLILFVAPVMLIVVHRFLTRGSARRDPLDLDSSPRFQRLEQTVETIAMEVERIAEGQRFTTAILAERHPGAAPRVEATPVQQREAITPR
jgi:hypothetical protein